jgi:dTDP-4-amino-4,6-dideoxygalactose transaminase
MRPKLPSAGRIAPYLDEIDRSRIYSNFGPLARSLEDRLAEHFGLGSGTVTTVANGTLGLTLALMAQDAQPNTLCLMPAWTFVASPHAAMMAGLTPYFVDVDPETWAIDVDAVAGMISTAPSAVGAIMPVAPFGRPLNIGAWDRFRARTKLPVVIDAAAGFDGLAPGDTPAVVSLHATKVIGVGEGGFVASRDTELIRAIQARSNFGFLGNRQSMARAANAKLSEYHAAVGHAALDEWAAMRAEWMTLAATYRKALARSNRVQFQHGFGESWIASTCILYFAGGAAAIETALASGGIESRRWWGDGAHAHPATRGLLRSVLPNTELLAKSTLSVPFYRDLPPEDMRNVAEHVLGAVEDRF